MHVVDNAPIAVKSLIAPLISAIIIVSMIGLFFVFYAQFQGATQTSARTGDLQVAARAAVIEVTTAHAGLYRAVSLKGQGGDAKLIHAITQEAIATLGRANAIMDGMRRNASADAATIAPVTDSLAAYLSAARQTADAAEQDAFVAAMQMNDAEVQFKTLRQRADALVEAAAANSERAAASVGSTLSRAAYEITVAGVLAILLSVAAGVFFGRRVSRPIRRMTSVMRTLAAGTLSVEVPDTGRHDETGDMARAVEVFKQHAIEVERLAAEQNAGAARERRRAAMEQHTQEFGASISGVMASLATSAEGMRRAAAAMTEAANAVHGEASGTAEGAAQSSQDLTSVAAAIEQLTTSVDEISRQVAAAADVARQAVRRAAASRGTMQGLVEATSRIGDVVQLISNIAGQTNLLALNATIEAARAGEAGKGFAVVAGEVKVLAAQTAKATAEIVSQIETVRGATGDAVAAMSEIGGIIGKMDEVSAAISAAVEEQGLTTREIASRVQAVSAATGRTAQAMTHVVEIAGNAGRASGDVLAGAAGIGHEAETLQAEVDHFMTAVRDETGERRRYERIPGNGAVVGLRTQGGDTARLPLNSFSRGGAALRCDLVLPPGATVEVDLPGSDGAVPGRVVRSGDGELAVVFSSDPQVLARIDRALDGLMATSRAA